MRRFSVLPGFALAAAALIMACGPSDGQVGGGGGDDDGDGFIDGGGGFVDGGGGFIDGGGFQEGVDAGSQGACDKMDILFVIDNSGSMAEEQMNLASNFPMFAQIVENYTTSAGGTLDYRLAITTTDKSYTNTAFGIPVPSVGNDGKFLTGTNCNFPAGRRYLQRGDANVPTIFSCVAKVGTGGDGNEMPLEAAKLALVDRMTGNPASATNVGFLREDALLAIVVLTDENDCSTKQTMFDLLTNPLDCNGTNLEPPTNYTTVFDGIKGGERGRWATAVIAGPTDCSSPGLGDAVAATRLIQFTQAVGTNQVFSSICDGDLAGALEDAFNTFGVACENIPPIE